MWRHRRRGFHQYMWVIKNVFSLWGFASLIPRLILWTKISALHMTESWVGPGNVQRNGFGICPGDGIVYWQLFSCSLEVECRAQGKEEAREAHFQQVRDLINHYDDGYRRLVRWTVKICPKARLFSWHRFTQFYLWVKLIKMKQEHNPSN